MPYIITTHPDLRTRVAVATLFDAHVAVDGLIEDYNGSIDEYADVPESGGTVGPLPDGTVIEVQRVGLGTLAARAGFAQYSDERSPADIIAAFNAA